MISSVIICSHKTWNPFSFSLIHTKKKITNNVEKKSIRNIIKEQVHWGKSQLTQATQPLTSGSV